MPIILKIGYDYFAMPSKKAAAAAVNALTGAIKLQRHYDAEGLILYVAEEQAEIGTLTVRPDQVLPRKPGSTVEAEPAQKQIFDSAPLRLRG